MRTSVDMVVVGRNIFFYGAEVPRRQLPDFSDKDFFERSICMSDSTQDK